MLGLSQSVFTAFEVNGFVTVCVELLEGRLERDVSISLETTEGSGVSSFNVHINCATNRGLSESKGCWC